MVLRWWLVGLTAVLCGCQAGEGLFTPAPPEEHGEPLACDQPPAAVDEPEINVPDEPQTPTSAPEKRATVDEEGTTAPAASERSEPPSPNVPETKPTDKASYARPKGPELPQGEVTKESRSIGVNGRTFRASVLRVPLGSFRVRIGLAQGRIGSIEAMADIARRHGAVAAINGCFFDAYSDRTVRNPYGHIATDGELLHIADHPTTFGYWADGTAAIGQVTYKVVGSLDGKEKWPGNWYAYGINDYPINETLAQLYTPRWALGDTPGDGIQIVVRNGKVASKAAGSHAIPNDGYIVYLRGKEKYLADRFKPGQACAYRVTAEANDREHDWAKVREALGCGPLLVADGQVSVDAPAEGFRDPKVLTNAGQRSALGLTGDGYLLLVTCSGATVKQLAHVMQGLGCRDAMNLDGGASSGLYFDGRFLTTPGREISNAVLVVPAT